MALNWRMFIRRHPRAIIVPFLVMAFFVLVTLLRDAPVLPSTVVPRYFYQQTYLKYSNSSTSYNIVLVADKDKASKNGNQWESILYHATLTREAGGRYSVEFTKENVIRSKMNEEGRGMELSDLTYFNGKLYSFDDRTGIVYEVVSEKDDTKVVARHILADGNGYSSKGFKCEWSTVKDKVMYIGGLGKEWTNQQGEVVSRDPQWVKSIDTEGRVEHHNWVNVYEKLRAATGTENPGYLIHEAVRFHPGSRRWYFLPRRVSKLEYNDEEDEKRGSNVMISTNEHFEDIKVSHVGPLIPSHGFSAFAFVPYRDNEIVALKTEELEGKINSYITVFNIYGDILMEETSVGPVKYEGVEFL